MRVVSTFKEHIRRQVLYYAPYLTSSLAMQAAEKLIQAEEQDYEVQDYNVVTCANASIALCRSCSRCEEPEPPVACCHESSALTESIDYDLSVNNEELLPLPRKATFAERVQAFFETEEESIAKQQQEEDYRNHCSERRTQALLQMLDRTIEALQLSGMSVEALHEFVDKRQTVSRLVITEDYRIFLPEYNNMEIVMSALPKALFFLFLRYPEGIVLKELQDHNAELYNIYRQLRPHSDEVRVALTVTNLVNPLSNAINENMARIRKAFVEKFDEHLAKHYIITGRPGEAYAIPLDRSLVEWKEE